MSKPRSVLGRGLGALIPGSETPTTAPHAAGIVEIPLDQLRPNPLQPRQDLRTDALEELAASIRAHGVIQPLVVTRVDEGYQIVTGERRWRAAQLAGLERVPAIIKETTPREMLELALVENLQRADLNPLEEASAYQQLMDEFGLTQEEVAAQVGKSRAAVANTMRLLKLPDAVQRALVAGEISEGHARALLALPTPDQQLHALESIRRGGLTVRQTEALVRTLQAQPPAKETSPAAEHLLSPQDRYLVERFEGRLGTRVELRRGKKGGRLVIHFYSDEELRAIYQAVVGEAV
ncbi:MAG: ParB/RepB/Spo0J family partition protein [Anaerolineae bacterium]|nr:ParB/RepB/Spo0J family partition protein [Anaerolineae bacterium]MDW8069953.1 ParB/RepB/Spo0J family partition protein [Anaerolineae bacterium]